jgi:NADPH:quinone reductase
VKHPVPTSADAWSIPAYGRVEDLVLGKLPVATPAADEMLVEIEAASLNPFDLKMIAGELRKMYPVSFPFVPGNDVCGHVVAVGAEVKTYKLRDRVVGYATKSGGMARYAICAEGPNSAHAPDSLSAEDLATLPEVGMTALAIMRAAELRGDDTVMIIGSTGGIGLLLCQLASQAGAHVIATAESHDEKLVRANGAHETIDYTKGDTVALLKAQYSAGVHVVIDLVNQNEALVASAAAVAKGGKLVSTLTGPDPTKFPPTVDVRYVRLSPSVGDLDQLVGAIADGSLRANVTGNFSFAHVREAYVSLRDSHARGKVVIGGFARD